MMSTPPKDASTGPLSQGLTFRAHPCKMDHSFSDFPVIRGAMGWLEAAHERHRCRRSRNSLFAKFRLKGTSNNDDFVVRYPATVA
jgi:hypothetical protein